MIARILFFLIGKKIKSDKGFTIIELLAITGIIALISGLILVSNSRFGGQVLLENLAYDVALTIRQAQVYGISVQRFDIDPSSSQFTFGAAYGVHFDTSDPSHFYTFADACTANGLRDIISGQCPKGEDAGQSSFDRGFKIIKLCAPALADTPACLADTVTNASPVDILFRRPDPDALISAFSASCVQGATCYQNVRIVVQSPRGDLSSVVVDSNGQIAVHK